MVYGCMFDDESNVIVHSMRNILIQSIDVLFVLKCAFSISNHTQSP